MPVRHLRRACRGCTALQCRCSTRGTHLQPLQPRRQVRRHGAGALQCRPARARPHVRRCCRHRVLPVRSSAQPGRHVWTVARSPIGTQRRALRRLAAAAAAAAARGGRVAAPRTARPAHWALALLASLSISRARSLGLHARVRPQRRRLLARAVAVGRAIAGCGARALHARPRPRRLEALHLHSRAGHTTRLRTSKPRHDPSLLTAPAPAACLPLSSCTPLPHPHRSPAPHLPQAQRRQRIATQPRQRRQVHTDRAGRRRRRVRRGRRVRARESAAHLLLLIAVPALIQQLHVDHGVRRAAAQQAIVRRAALRDAHRVARWSVQRANLARGRTRAGRLGGGAPRGQRLVIHGYVPGAADGAPTSSVTAPLHLEC
jgi:hypothetical protein